MEFFVQDLVSVGRNVAFDQLVVHFLEELLESFIVLLEGICLGSSAFLQSKLDRLFSRFSQLECAEAEAIEDQSDLKISGRNFHCHLGCINSHPALILEQVSKESRVVARLVVFNFLCHHVGFEVLKNTSPDLILVDSLAASLGIDVALDISKHFPDRWSAPGCV